MPVEIVKGNGPVILALPYTGTDFPRLAARRLQNEASLVTAPDRFLDRLLADVHPGISIVSARFHRYLSDVEQPVPQYNRAQKPGMVGVVPLWDRQGNNIWYEPPGMTEAARWHSTFYVPYHAALRAQIARVRSQFGHVVLVTCRALPEAGAQSEKSGPVDLRLSNNLGTSCAIDLSSRLMSFLLENKRFSTFFGGNVEIGRVTQSYARPTAGVHALVLEINEANYLGNDDLDGVFDAEKSKPLRELLAEIFAIMHRWKPD